MNFLELVILNDITQLRLLEQSIEKLGDEWNISPKVGMNINLVLEEIITNIIFYGYEDDLEHRINIEFRKSAKEIIITIIDDAKAFDISETKEFGDLDKNAEERNIGGLGIHFVKTLMDKVEYRREEDKNILMLWKKI